VVDLDVEAVLVVVRGSDRAHRLARRGLAVLAHHGDEAQLDVGIRAFPVALDAEPRHLAAPCEGLLADDRQIVLGLACDHARLAAHATIEIDRQGPGVVELLVVAGLAVFPPFLAQAAFGFGWFAPARCGGHADTTLIGMLRSPALWSELVVVVA